MSTTFTSADQAVRRAQASESAHSGAMEGYTVTSETLADAECYIDGAIDADDLVSRTRSRYGLS